jgi:hypothetical protein
MYVFADSCSSEIFFAKPDEQGAWSYTVWRNDANGYGTYSGFGEDEAGNLYVANTAADVVYLFHSDIADRIFADGFETPPSAAARTTAPTAPSSPSTRSH